MKSRNVVLVGFMGTGKSTVGRLLAEKLGWSFVDTDKFIEREQGMTIPELFERSGETVFRTLETDAIRRVIDEGNQVIATGGGAVLAEANRTVMLQGGYVIALKADKSAIIERVGKDSGRPLLQGDVEGRVTRLLEERRQAYDFADLIVDTTGLSPEQVADIILIKRKEAV